MRLLPDDVRRGEALAYLWYLSFLLLQPALGENSPEEWLVIAASIAVFLPLYFSVFWQRGRRARWLIWAIAALGLVTMPFNAGAGTYLVYAAALIPWHAPVRVALVSDGVWVLAILVEAVVLGLPMWTWMVAVIGTTAIGAATIHAAETQRQHRQLLRAQEEVEQMAAVAERERIARDLHDVLGHTLAVIALKSELAARLAESDPPRAASEIREVERVSREALRDVREAIEGYRQRGLPAEIEAARAALSVAGIALDVEVPPLALSARLETALAMTLREAVTNVVRHSGASWCRVWLQADGDYATLTVLDDGRGGRLTEGHGLSGIRSRIRQLGGRVDVESGRGVRVAITLPLAGPAAP
jgi:two-component system sensor histidine kinase DesK